MPSYYDLNIAESSKSKDIVRYVRCGYTRLALNRIVNVDDFFPVETDSKKSSKEKRAQFRQSCESRLRPPDGRALIDRDVREAAAKLGCQVELFSRLTIAAADLNALTNFLREFATAVKQYEIVAIEARSPDVLAFATNSAPVELVSLEARGSIALNRSALERCRDRSVRLELDLAPALASAGGRAHAARLVSELALLRCPDILTATSGAASSILVRNPLGVACLLASLGLPDKLLRSLHDNARSVVQRALARKHTVHGSAAIVALSKLPGVLSVTAAASAPAAPAAPDPAARPPARKKQKTHNH